MTSQAWSLLFNEPATAKACAFLFSYCSPKEEVFSHLWCLPSLSIHGIEGAFHEPGLKTVIPSRVIGKFSIRQVPHMDLSKVEHQVRLLVYVMTVIQPVARWFSSKLWFNTRVLTL